MVVRRLLLVALLAGGAVLLGAGPAAAHLCARPAELTVGQAGSVDVAVTVEGTPVPDVEVDIPAALQINRVDPTEGWKITRTGSTLRYRGDPIPPYSCVYFSMSLTAPARGSWRVPVTQRAADGTVVAHTPTDPNQKLDPYVEQTVYAGVTPPGPPSQGGGISWVTVLGIAFVAIAVLLAGVFGWRAWRARHDEYAELDDEQFDAAMRELEVQERVAEFKKRTRRRPARH